VAIDPRISLGVKVPDVGQTFSNILLNAERFDKIRQDRRESPIRQRLLEAQTGAAEAAVPTSQQIQNQRDRSRATSIANAAVSLNALPTNEDRLNFARSRRTQLIAEGQKTGQPVNTEDTDLFISKMESGDFTGAQQLLDSSIQMGKTLGIITLQKTGLASAKTEILDTGATIQVHPTGETIVTDPSGAEVTGQARLDILQQARDQAKAKIQERADVTVQTAKRVKDVEKASKTADNAFGMVEKIRQNITNLREVTPLISQGANTGPIISLFPSIKAETIKLEQLQRRLGLDVVGAVTFGALSKGELDLAKSVALPIGLEGDALIQWTNETIAAKEKLANYYEEQAIFLGQGNTQADWLKKKKAELKEMMGDATESDIRATMKANNMTRPQVLQELKRRQSSGGA